MLEKICTNFETSRRLNELGIENEAFFYWWFFDFDKKYHLTSEDECIASSHLKNNKTKAYTLEQILEMLPEYIVRKDKRSKSGEIVLTLMLGKKSLWYANFMIEDSEEININEDCNNLTTAAAKLLIKLKEDKII